MSIEIGIISVLSIFGLAGIVLSFRRRSRVSELRDLLEFSQKQIDELHEAVSKARDSSEAAQVRAADQARRVAWLESKMRKPKNPSPEVLDDSIITETPKLSMTERRHRVINLANRGKNAESIAASLGLFRGEVELILSLDRAAIGAK